jgi:hypothetical protein
MEKQEIINNPIDGFDFAASLDRQAVYYEILGLLNENKYTGPSRSMVMEIISNLSRTLLIGNLRNSTPEEIGKAVDRAINGDTASITTIDLPEDKKQIVKKFILGKLDEAMK